MLAIKNNIMAENAARHLGMAYDSLSESVERLSSGLRINSAKDDAAGLAVRELIRADVAVLQQGSRNAQDGISMIQTMEGAMAVMDEVLIRMTELAEQAATGSYSDAQRTIMNAEFTEMASEIDRIAGATKFNDISMLNSGTGSVSIHVGTTETIDVAPVDMTTAASGLNIETGQSTTSLTGTDGTSDADVANFLVYNDSGGTVAGTLTIQFTDADTDANDHETAVVVSFSDTEAVTLNELVEKINAVSLNLDIAGDGTVQAYSMASVYHNNDDGNDYLKLTSRAGGVVDDATVVMTSTGTEDISDSVGFTTENEADLTVDMSAAAVDAGINISNVANAVTALERITSAITEKDEARASFGYKMNRLESTISILDIQAENLMAAESRISDVDVATEMAKLTRTQVLTQAGIAMLAQANAMPQMALTLLR
ncbi:MAG: flagellin N-terminal helical domain-containing protein [Planctomycetota bacterium]|jgi:flagellin